MTAPAPERFKILFETTAGDIVVEVDRSKAPLGADRFHNLIREGFYDQARFFRVLPGFVVQFGLPADPQWAAVWRSAPIQDDSVRVSNIRGTLSFATAGPDTRTTQVFINLGDNSRLDAQGFAPFASVTGGMDVVERLFGGYGEGFPSGRGPAQFRIEQEGEAYLAEDFPRLDQILRTRILEVPLPVEPDPETGSMDPLALGRP